METDKNIAKNSEDGYRYWLAIITIIGMMAGLFISRALLSVSMLFFVANGIINPHIGTFFKEGIKNKLSVGFAILFFVPLISVLWSDDKQEWLSRTSVKLPLLLLPFGFYVIRKIRETHFRYLSVLFILFMLAGSVWSVMKYIESPGFYHNQYLMAKVIPTPFDANYIYFSFTVVVTVLLLIKLFTATGNNLLRWAYGITSLWFIIYLHILSAKTGLLCLYISLLLIGILLLKKKNKGKAIIIVLLALSFPFIAYRFAPTFKNRVAYIVYDYNHYSRGNYIEGLSDGSRYRSILAGQNIFAGNKFIGVGFGDIMEAANNWYYERHPQIKNYERMLPSSEWLLYACGAGIAGAILFLLAVLLPFFYKPMGYDITWWALQTIAVIFLLYEVSLEGQFGVFIYAFFSCWWNLTRKEKKTI